MSVSITSCSVRLKRQNAATVAGQTVVASIFATDASHNPTGAALATGSISLASISTSPANYIFSMSAELEIDTGYILVLSESEWSDIAAFADVDVRWMGDVTVSPSIYRRVYGYFGGSPGTGSWSPVSADTTISYAFAVYTSSFAVIDRLTSDDSNSAGQFYKSHYSGSYWEGRRGVTFTLSDETPPYNPTPADSAEDVNLPITQLSWDCDGTPDSYKVYFGTELEGPELIDTVTTKYVNVDSQFIDPGLTYNWYVKAIYGENEVESDVWTFETEAIGAALGVPYSPTPADTATDVPLSTELLEWECYAPDGQFGGAVVYEVYFSGVKLGTTSSKNYAMPRHLLAYNTTYEWYVIVRNSASSNTGPTWTFTTAALVMLYPAGDNFGTRVKRLVAAADDKIWYEEL